jgi:hypothetical protein
MERKFHVIFTGRLHAGFHQNDIVENMALLFHLDRHKVAKLLSSGRPTIMKQGLSWEQAQRYCHHLEQIGLRMKTAEADTLQLQAATSSPAPAPQSANEIPAPVIPAPPSGTRATHAAVPDFSKKAKGPSFTNVVPEDSPAPEKPIGNLLPLKVENSHGWLWIKKAFGILFRHPLKWTMIMGLLLLLLLPLASIHLFGGLLIGILASVFHSGIMWGAQNQNQGRQLRIAHLFHGFTRDFTQLLLVGMANLLLLTSCAAIMILCISKIISPASIPEVADLLTAANQNLSIFLTGLLGLSAFTVILLMGCWFAPCLVTLDKRSAFAGFRLSFTAVRMNGRAFFIYGLALLLLGLLFFFFYGATAALFALLFGPEHIFLSMLLPMGCIILVAVPITAILPLSIYTGYRDIFHGQLH